MGHIRPIVVFKQLPLARYSELWCAQVKSNTVSSVGSRWVKRKATCIEFKVRLVHWGEETRLNREHGGKGISFGHDGGCGKSCLPYCERLN